jgi:hypothetical protein
MNRKTIALASGAALGAIVGGAIAYVSHLTAYWPYVLIAVGAATGGILIPLIFGRK